MVSKILRDSESRKRYADEVDVIDRELFGANDGSIDMTSSTRMVFRNGEVPVTIINDSGLESGYVDHKRHCIQKDFEVSDVLTFDRVLWYS